MKLCIVLVRNECKNTQVEVKDQIKNVVVFKAHEYSLVFVSNITILGLRRRLREVSLYFESYEVFSILLCFVTSYLGRIYNISTITKCNINHH